MSDKKAIDLEKLKGYLETLYGIDQNFATNLREYIIGCWAGKGFVEEDDFDILLDDLKEMKNPTQEIGEFLDRVFIRMPSKIKAYFKMTPELLEIHDGIEKVWDAWNGLEMRDDPKEMIRDMMLSLELLGATSEDIKSVREKLKMRKFAERPLSVFRTEILRLRKLKEKQNVKEKEKEEIS